MLNRPSLFVSAYNGEKGLLDSKSHQAYLETLLHGLFRHNWSLLQ